MACGTPVLTATTSSMPEVAGDAALLVDPTSAEAMARGINQLIQDTTLRTTLRRKGLQRAALFSWQETARQLLDVYTSCLAKNSKQLVS
jgi:glycosyltransferase involved in cell wall biosynthesis